MYAGVYEAQIAEKPMFLSFQEKHGLFLWDFIKSCGSRFTICVVWWIFLFKNKSCENFLQFFGNDFFGCGILRVDRF